MLGVRSRRLRFICLGIVSTAAVLATGADLPSIDNSANTGHLNATTTGAAHAQFPSLQEGLRRATERLGGAEAVTLENLSIDVGFAVYRIPRIEFAGVNLSRAELLSLFDKNAAEPVAPRLARLSAKQVKVPELIVEQQVGGDRQITRYRDLVIDNVTNGRIASAVSAGGSFELKDPQSGATSGTIGRLTLTDLDMPEAVRIYSERAGAATPELKRIYGAFSLEDLTLASEKGARIRIARMAGKDFSARPTKASWMETMKTLGSLESPDKAAADQARIMGAVADIFDAMQVGSMEATGIEISDPTDKKEPAGRIARIGYSSAAAGRPSDMRVESLEIGAKDGKARIGLIAFTGFSLAPTFSELRALGDKPITDLDASALRRLIPTIGTIRISGIDLHVPNEASKDPKAENIRFSVGDLEMTADKPLNGIPTNLRVGLKDFRMAIPPDTKEDGLQELAALGYRNLDMSWLTAAFWNEPGNELVLRELSVSGAQMGSASLRGTIGGVTKDVFDPDGAVALVALFGATVKNAQLTVENGGLFEKLLDQEARKQKKSVDDLRKELGIAAAVAIPAMLGNSGAAKTIGQTVARFVAKPGKLTISARTKDPAGLGIGDLGSIGEPGAILEKLEVTATAE
jgi:hypothetical protein